MIAIKIVLLIDKPYDDSSAIEKFKNIADKLILALGIPDKTMSDTLGLIWFGSKVSMGFTYNAEKMGIDEKGKNTGLTSLKLVVMSNSGGKKEINKGF